MNTFPRGITALHALELTSRCSLKCSYCPSPQIVAGKFPKRTALDMTHRTFVRALEWVAHFVDQGTQKELNLSGIGESMLHPDFLYFAKIARSVVGPRVGIIIPTNGLHVTEENAKELAALDIEVWVSAHVPAKAALADHILRKHGVKGRLSADPIVNANTWAGQVDVPWATNQKFPCPWGWKGQAFVMADGRISRCCLDASGEGVFGHVDDEVGSLKWSPWNLCEGCYQTLPT